MCGGIWAEGGQNTERKPLGIHLSEPVFWTAIDKDRPMSRREHLHVGAPRTADRSCEGYEASSGKVSSEFFIDSFKGRREIPGRGKVGSGISVAHRGQQRRSDAVTGNIGETDYHLPVGQGLPVEIVTSGIVCRPIPASNVKSRKMRRIPRKKRLLD